MKDIVRINRKTKEVIIQNEGIIYEGLGGRGLISYLMQEEVDPKTDPLGAGNKFILAGMLLSGTPIPTVNRLSIGGKSPLTNGIKESNVGGTAGTYMASHGIKAMIFEDVPEDNILQIFIVKKDGTLSFEDGEYLRGKGTYETTAILFEKLGKDISIVVNGVAGERRYSNSSIQVSEMGTGYPCRAAGRGGMGAVMGTKGLKAIVFEKPYNQYQQKYADKERFEKAKKAIVQSLINSKGILSDVGTVGFMAATIPTGIMPYKNFNGGIMTLEQQEKFNLQTVVERIRAYGGKTGHSCQTGCIIQCSNVINNQNGEQLTAGFEYETAGLFGPNCDIYDIEAIFKMDRFCDDFGFDTIELGASVGAYMEAGKLAWGDAEGVLEMFDSFWEENNPIVEDFGKGAYKLGKKYGSCRIPTVKGQAIAAYDPRNLKGTGVTYALSPMGADHTAGPTLSRRDVNPVGKEGQVDASLAAQVGIAACDCNVCLFSWAGIAGGLPEAINGTLGYEWSFADILKLGNETLLRERTFNRLAGFNENDDMLPAFFYTEPSVTGSVYDIPKAEINEKWHNEFNKE
ncbi:MAG TPA: aldehyde ferredoxin oxidoreductase C-terminal domain-containing protein [Anaerovoracaceae bacterium]|nr:aldehyde ferredoxin oxidoreductase C-terminal domain-containing protein [Anaerovoracaceae bacterium]